MLFNSVGFALFFIQVVVLFYLLPFRFRWILLLIASYYYYFSWGWPFLIFLAASTLLDFVIGRLIDQEKVKLKRKLYLGISVLGNIGALFFVKNIQFFPVASKFLSEVGTLSPLVVENVFIPIGISFYTFQTLSYTIDIYRRERVAEMHLGYFALYVSFFPQLIAGPIERSSVLLPQFKTKTIFSYDRFVGGLRLVLWGLFKKSFIADRISQFVDPIYGDPSSFLALDFILSAFLFAFQVYCDFSGYIDMARGFAKILGFELSINFKNPFFASSLSDFWSRWNITLMQWFRDYLYYPMRTIGVPRGIAIVGLFLLSGLWHGSGWNFILWGLLQGLYFYFYLLLSPRLKIPIKLEKILGVSSVFFLFSSSTFLFRLESFDHLPVIYNKLTSELCLIQVTKHIADQSYGLALSFIGLGLLIYFERRYESFGFQGSFDRLGVFKRWTIYLFLAILTVAFGQFENRLFIYFQF